MEATKSADKLIAEATSAKLNAQAAADAERHKREEAEAKIAALMRQLEEMEELQKKEEELNAAVVAAAAEEPLGQVAAESIPSKVPCAKFEEEPSAEAMGVAMLPSPPPPSPLNDEFCQLVPPCADKAGTLEQLVNDLGGNFSPEDDITMPLKPFNRISSPSTQQKQTQKQPLSTDRGILAKESSDVHAPQASLPAAPAVVVNSLPAAAVHGTKSKSTRSPGEGESPPRPVPASRMRVGNIRGSTAPVGLFSLFRGLAGPGNEGSGDTVMGDNSNLSGDEVEGSENDGEEECVSEGKDVGRAGGGSKGRRHSDSLMNEPEPVYSQGSQAERGVVEQEK